MMPPASRVAAFTLHGANASLVNAIRRVIFQSVPNYGFDADGIDIKTNTTVLNNDELRQRLSNFPVFGLEHGPATFQSFLTRHRDLVVMNDTSCPEGRGPAPPPALMISCRITHDRPGVDLLPLMTADCRFSVDGKEVSDPYRSAPLLLCYLHPGEELAFTATSRMATPRISASYIIGNAYFVGMKGDEDFLFTVESRAEVSAAEVFRRATVILLEKVDAFVASAEGGHEGVLPVARDKYTLSGLITDYMQGHKDVEYAGYRCPHMLDDASEILFRLAPKAQLGRVLSDAAASIKKDVAAVLKQI